VADRNSVRDEDAFDVVSMDAWLRDHIAGLPDAQPEVEQFSKGASNLTYLLHYPGRDLVLRRPPRGTKAKSAHDMGREVHVITHIRDQFSAVPEVFAYCQDETVIGTPFYVMEYLDGVILRPDNADLLDSAAANLVGDAYVDRWVQLHQVDVDRADLADWGKGPGYVRRQIEGWSDRYRRALTDDVPDGESVMAWLASNQPDDVGACVIHGDWRLDNMVFDGIVKGEASSPSIIGVLDWEMATIGDPLMDVGAALAYWIDRDDASVDPAFAALKRQPSDLPGMPTRDEIVDRYCEQMGFADVDWRFYEVYGLFRLAVILQQIWARYRAGQTTNPAFAPFGQAVHVLIDRAARAR
jgi:aminoglycoside phosphotransferase (APT) family kinase protein